MKIGYIKMCVRLTGLVAALLILGTDARAAGSGPSQTNRSTLEMAANLGQETFQFTGSVFDFGKVKEGTVIKHEFVFTNKGPTSLEVSSVTSPSSHIRVDDWTKSVMAGQTGRISIEISTEGLVKKVSLPIIVASNDKSSRLLTLQVNGEVWNAVEINPPRLVLNVVSGTASNALAMTYIINHSDQPLKLSDPETGSPIVKAELTSLHSDKGYQLELRATGEPNHGLPPGKITIKTDWTNRPTLTVPYTMALVPVFTITPARIMLPMDFANQPYETTVSIKCNGSVPVVLEKPSINVKGVTVSSTTESGHEYIIKLTFAKNFEISPRERACLTIKAPDARYPLIQVPILKPPHFHAPTARQ